MDFQEYLKKGETVLWSGKPEAFETLDKTHKTPFRKKLIITAAVVVAVCVAWLLFLLKENSGRSGWGVYAVAVAAGAYTVISLFLDSNKIRKMSYAITNKRVLVCSNGNVTGAEYATLSGARFVTDEDGHVSFLAGADAIKAKPEKRRALCAVGPRPLVEGQCDCVVLYAVSEPDLAKEAIAPFLTLE